MYVCFRELGKFQLLNASCYCLVWIFQLTRSSFSYKGGCLHGNFRELYRIMVIIDYKKIVFSVQFGILPMIIDWQYWGLTSCCDVNTEEQWASCNPAYSQKIIYNSDPAKVPSKIYSKKIIIIKQHNHESLSVGVHSFFPLHAMPVQDQFQPV